jgi:tetratricopeptide (TPR) repeat protein
MKVKRGKVLIKISVLTLAASLTGCASMRSFFALNNASQAPSAPIHNPFGDNYAGKNDSSQNLILRTKKGDRSVEIELPKSSQEMTDFTIPISPAFRDTGGRSPAGDGGDGNSGNSYDDSYKTKPPTMADREITRSFPQGNAKDDGQRRDIEQGLGLMPAEDSTPQADSSYLAALDHVKSMYKVGRYEAALVENDGMIRSYPTDPKLYQMRGTLLDRLGQTDLALKSWNQSLRFDPKNSPLRKFVERREQKRSLASP